ncbi:YdiY family protein [Rhodoferax sp.]|uniref:DUF481 domain-containing protein n=1 Tax=Rhodoferax sp. TaxID=50421 RepID=UPI00374DCBCD
MDFDASKMTGSARGVTASTAARLVCGLGFAVCLATAAQAAKLTLDNGDQLTGEIVLLKDRSLTFNSPLFGKVQIPWDKVTELRSDDGVRVQLADGTQLSGALLLQPDGQLQVSPPASAPAAAGIRVARADVLMLNPPEADNAVKHSGRVALGGTFNQGNSTDELLHLDTELIGRAPMNRYTLNAVANEARSAHIRTASNRLLTGQYDTFLDPKNYLFVNLKLQNDKQADLTLRSTLGGGYGRQFLESDQAKLSLESGLNFVHENYAIAEDKSFPALGLGLNYEQKLFSSTLVFFNNARVSVNLQDASDTQITNKMGFRVPLGRGLNLSTQLNLAYDHAPPLGVRKTDRNLVIGVGYAF